MRTLLVVAALAAAWACPTLWAAEKEKAGGADVAVQDLNLSDEQEAKIADIRKEFQPKAQEAARELGGLVKEEVEKVRAVLTAEQREKLQAAREERKEGRGEGLAGRVAHLRELHLTEAERGEVTKIRDEYHPKIVKAMEGLKGILSAQQRTAREEGLKSGKKRREILGSLNLTEEQKEKVQAVGKEVATLVREEMEKIRDVLTDSQKEKLADLKDERKEHARDRMAHRIANLKDLNLTEEQKTKIAEIRKEYRPRIHEAGNKLRGTVREEVQMIVAVLKG
jgi:Spy/CpxP family protein refolding chaperone